VTQDHKEPQATPGQPVTTGTPVRPGLPVTLVIPVPQDLLEQVPRGTQDPPDLRVVRPDQQGRLDLSVLPETLVRRVQQAFGGLRATLDQLEIEVILAPVGAVARLVPQVLKDRPELQVRPGARGQPVLMEPREELVQQVRRALQEAQATQARQDLAAMMEALVTPVPPAPRVTGVTLGQQEYRVRRVKLGRQARQVPRAILARRERKE